jgi:hypothetical protein
MAMQKYGNLYNQNGTPVMGSMLWYRLMALEGLTKDQLKDMLAYLAGYDDTGWDKAYESTMGKPLGDADDDSSMPDAPYADAVSAFPKLNANSDYGRELLEESRGKHTDPHYRPTETFPSLDDSSGG